MNPTPELRAKLRDLHAKATQGRWIAARYSKTKMGLGASGGSAFYILECPNMSWGNPESLTELEFIIEAHNALPGLLDALDAADREIARLKAESDAEMHCDECGGNFHTELWNDKEQLCRRCAAEFGAEDGDDEGTANDA